MSLDTARELHARGRSENARGRHASAITYLQRALRILDLDGSGQPAGDGPEVAAAGLVRARVLLTMGWAQAELHGLDRGLSFIERVYGLVATDGPLSAEDAAGMRTALHNQHGLLLLRAGRTQAAYEQFAEAARWFAHAPALEQCNVLLNRGAVGLNTLAIPAARRDLTRCAELARRSQLPLLEFKARHNLGCLEFLAGDLPLALQLMDEASAIVVDHSRGVDLIDRAKVLVEAGLTRDADETLAEAISLLQEDKSSTHDLAEAELARARCALQTADWAAARQLAGQAQRRFQRRGNQRRAANAKLIALAAECGLGKHGTPLISRARVLSSQLIDHGQRSEARTATLLAAELLLGANRLTEAQQLLTGLGTVAPDERVGVKVHSRYVRARAALAAGEAQRAKREIHTGLRELATYRASFGSIDAQTASAVHGVRLADLDLATAVESGRPALVLAAVERVRAVGSGLPAIRPPDDEIVAALLTELRQVVTRLQSGALDESPAELVAHRRRLETSIKARSWALAGDGAAKRAADIPSVRRALSDAGAEMVMYFEVRGVLYSLLITSRQCGLSELGRTARVVEQIRRVRADLDLLAGDLPTAVRRAAVASLSRSLDDLDAAIVRPLQLRKQRLVIVPTGLLGAIPWGTLPSLRRVTSTVVPSATGWLAARRSAQAAAADPSHAPAPRVLAIAGPGLKRADTEAEWAAGMWPDGGAITGAAATGQAVRHALGHSRIVHVAAHGRHDPDNPLFSFIRLADGPLYAYDLVGDVAPGVHVVLSSCELGLATIRPGDQPLGLTSALLHHGAATVVSGVARVADDVAADVMARHHTELACGSPPAEALALAVEGNVHAPFVCFGAGFEPILQHAT